MTAAQINTAVTPFADTVQTRRPHAAAMARLACLSVVRPRDRKSGALRSRGSRPLRGAVSPTSECGELGDAPAAIPRACIADRQRPSLRTTDIYARNLSTSSATLLQGTRPRGIPRARGDRHRWEAKAPRPSVLEERFTEGIKR